MLRIRDLNKKYTTSHGEVIALQQVSLHIKKGEFVAIMGGSGSGKTTLLNMIGGLDIPDCGSILFDGVEIVELSQKKLALMRRKKIGIIYQFYNLIPELTVSENVALPTELDGEAVDSIRLDEMLRAVGLQERSTSYPNTLSGGQQQRVAIARALFNRPILILADEPTGNLDAENSREILSLLYEMNREYGMTVLMVTHSAEAAANADRVITIESGRILSDRRTNHEADR